MEKPRNPPLFGCYELLETGEVVASNSGPETEITSATSSRDWRCRR